MSRQSSIEKRLLDNVTSLKKMMVQCDINGWNETNRKHPPSPKHKIFFRPKIRQKSVKALPPHKLDTINDEIERDPSVQKLIFHNKDNTSSTHCTKRLRKVTLDNHPLHSTSNEDIPSPEINTKPFNSGYVLKELRKRVLQRSYLKKFTPVVSSAHLAKSECMQELDTKNSIRYFQSQYKRLGVLSSRAAKPSLRRA